MEKEPSLGIRLEVMRSELRTTLGQFGSHVKNTHKGVMPISCHTCINYKQIIVLQEYHIGNFVAELNRQSQRPLSE